MVSKFELAFKPQFESLTVHCSLTLAIQTLPTTEYPSQWSNPTMRIQPWLGLLWLSNWITTSLPWRSLAATNWSRKSRLHRKPGSRMPKPSQQWWCRRSRGNKWSRISQMNRPTIQLSKTRHFTRCTTSLTTPICKQNRRLQSRNLARIKCVSLQAFQILMSARRHSTRPRTSRPSFLIWKTSCHQVRSAKNNCRSEIRSNSSRLKWSSKWTFCPAKMKKCRTRRSWSRTSSARTSKLARKRTSCHPVTSFRVSETIPRSLTRRTSTSARPISTWWTRTCVTDRRMKCSTTETALKCPANHSRSCCRTKLRVLWSRLTRRQTRPRRASTSISVSGSRETRNLSSTPIRRHKTHPTLKPCCRKLSCWMARR